MFWIGLFIGVPLGIIASALVGHIEATHVDEDDRMYALELEPMSQAVIRQYELRELERIGRL